MPAARPLTPAQLREAARIAREEGVSLRVERDPSGTLLYQITPGAHGGGDDEIEAITGHRTGAMVKKYAGEARQRNRAEKAQKRRK